MSEGPFGGPRFTRLAELKYEITIEPPIRQDVKKIENIVVGAVDQHIIPDVATKDVTSLRVQESGVPENEQDLSIIVETDNMSTSNHTLNAIEEEINKSIAGNVTMVSVEASPTNPVKQLIDRIR
jgi:hypothetical protein